MLGNSAITARFHQLLKQAFWIVFGFNAMALFGRLQGAISGLLGRRDRLRQGAAQLLEAIQATGIKAHEQPRVSRVSRPVTGFTPSALAHSTLSASARRGTLVKSAPSTVTLMKRVLKANASSSTALVRLVPSKTAESSVASRRLLLLKLAS